MMRGDDDDTLVIEEKAVVKVDDKTYIVPGALSVQRTEDETGIEVPPNERYETIAGFFIDKSQRMPEVGHTTSFNDTIYMEVIEMDGNRIERLKIQNIATDVASDPSA